MTREDALWLVTRLNPSDLSDSMEELKCFPELLELVQKRDKLERIMKLVMLGLEHEN